MRIEIVAMSAFFTIVINEIVRAWLKKKKKKEDNRPAFMKSNHIFPALLCKPWKDLDGYIHIPHKWINYKGEVLSESDVVYKPYTENIQWFNDITGSESS